MRRAKSALAAARWRWGWIALMGIALVAVLAVALGSFLPVGGGQGETREFILEASKFSYSPERLRVNKGDHIIVRLRPQDVSHGLYLDGYALETHAMPGGEGVLDFVADSPGKFRFRCSVTCGNLHPFMIGELNVESGTPYTNAPFLAAAAAMLLVAGGSMAFVWRRMESNGGTGS